MTHPTPPNSAADLPAIQRFKIGYASDYWGTRSSTPRGIPDPSGSWVRYADHVAALAGVQPAPAAVQPVAPTDDDQTSKEQYRNMFNAACSDLGAINEALGLDPDDGGAGPIIDAIRELQDGATTAQAISAEPAGAAEWTRDQITAFCNVALRNVELVDGKGPTLVEVRQGVAAAIAARTTLKPQAADAPAPQPSPSPAPAQQANDMAGQPGQESWRVPCPFCGGEYTGRTFHKGSQVIECQDCLARGPQSDDADAAKRAWANRAPQAAQRPDAGVVEDALIEALELGLDCAQEVAANFHEAYKGHRPHDHTAVDADVEKIKTVLAAARSAQEEPAQGGA